MKLGSLFDGIGGFPYSASKFGIIPVWASEIEPWPIKVTQKHFPGMKHLGDITKINGAEVEPVDVITFGSPCQSVSVAGKRKGLKITCKSCGHVSQGEVLFACPICGEETDVAASALFFEAIRVIEEMQTATNREYPKAVAFENVPGLLSSEKGKDFIAVLDNLQDLGFILDPNILDAQYMGVPQRRRRIFIACVSVDIIRKMKTPTSLAIISQLLIEILLCILNEQLNLSEGGVKNSIWKEKRLAVGGLQKKMKLFSIEARENFEILLNNWLEICQTHLKEQCYLESHLEKSDTTAKTDTNKKEFPTEMELEKLFGSTLRLWKELLDGLYCQENSCITLTAIRETTNQIIYGCANLLENTALLIGLLRNYSPISWETESFILTARKECISYARQANSEIFTDMGWVLRWNDYLDWVSSCREQIERYFGNECGPEIFPFSEGLRGDSAQSREAREEAAGNAGDGTEKSNGIIPFDTTQITSPQNGNNPKPNDPCHPLCANAHVPSIAIPQAIGFDNQTGQSEGIEVSPSVRSESHGSLPCVASRINCTPDGITGAVSSKRAKGTGGPAGDEHYNLIVLADQGGSQMDVHDNISPTLRSQEHGHQPLVIREVSRTLRANAGAPKHESDWESLVIQEREGHPAESGEAREEVSFTLNTIDRHAVAYPDPANTLLAKANLSFRGDQDTLVAGLDCRNGKENGDLCGTLQAKANGGFSYNCTHPVRIGYAVRRLTPLETERLQGLPDNWTNIEGMSDSAKYKAVGNSVAIPCVDFVMSGIAGVLREGYIND